MSQSVVLSAVPSAFTPFNADELSEIRLYHDLVADLDAHDLAKTQELRFEIDRQGSLARG